MHALPSVNERAALRQCTATPCQLRWRWATHPEMACWFIEPNWFNISRIIKETRWLRPGLNYFQMVFSSGVLCMPYRPQNYLHYDIDFTTNFSYHISMNSDDRANETVPDEKISGGWSSLVLRVPQHAQCFQTGRF
jgi:hypothetical protein